MSTPTVSLLRQRMIESLPPRRRREGGGHERSQALCGTQRGHIRSCKRFAAFLKRSPETPRPRTSACSSCTWPRRA